MSSSNEDRAAHHRDGQDKPSDGESSRNLVISPWLGPITTVDFLLTKICEYCRKKQAGSNLRIAPGRSAQSFRSVVGGIIAVLVAAGIAGLVLRRFGYLDGPDHVVALFTFVLAGVAGIQFWISYMQFKQTDRTLELMQLQMQPWIVIANPRMQVILSSGEPLYIAFEIRNTGSTAAMVFFTRAVAQTVVPGMPPIEFEEMATRTPGNGIENCMVAVSGQQESTCQRFLEALSAEQINAIRDESKSLLVLLQVAYRNPFGHLDSFICTCQYHWSFEMLTTLESRIVQRVRPD